MKHLDIRMLLLEHNEHATLLRRRAFITIPVEYLELDGLVSLLIVRHLLRFRYLHHNFDTPIDPARLIPSISILYYHTRVNESVHLLYRRDLSAVIHRYCGGSPLIGRLS